MVTISIMDKLTPVCVRSKLDPKPQNSEPLNHQPRNNFLTEFLGLRPLLLGFRV